MIEGKFVLDIVAAKNIGYLRGEKFRQWFDFIGVTAAFVELNLAVFSLPAFCICTIRSEFWGC